MTAILLVTATGTVQQFACQHLGQTMTMSKKQVISEEGRGQRGHWTRGIMPLISCSGSDEQENSNIQIFE